MKREVNLTRYHITRGYTENGWSMCSTLKTEPAEWIDREECVAHFNKLGLKEPYYVSGYQIELKDAVTCTTPIEYLRREEWTMGNGQCHECGGLDPEGWPTNQIVGHKLTCQKAKAIEALGGEVFWIGPNPNINQEMLDAAIAWKNKNKDK